MANKTKSLCCPNCGAPISISNKSVPLARCEYCDSLINLKKVFPASVRLVENDKGKKPTHNHATITVNILSSTDDKTGSKNRFDEEEQKNYEMKNWDKIQSSLLILFFSLAFFVLCGIFFASC